MTLMSCSSESLSKFSEFVLVSFVCCNIIHFFLSVYTHFEKKVSVKYEQKQLILRNWWQEWISWRNQHIYLSNRPDTFHNILHRKLQVDNKISIKNLKNIQCYRIQEQIFCTRLGLTLLKCILFLLSQTKIFFINFTMMQTVYALRIIYHTLYILYSFCVF